MYKNVVKNDDQIQVLCNNILEKSALGQKRPRPIDGGMRAKHSMQSMQNWKMYATAERVILPGKKRESIIYVRRTGKV